MTIPFKIEEINHVLFADSGRIGFSNQDDNETVIVFEENEEYNSFLNLIQKLQSKPFVEMFLLIPNFQTTFRHNQGLVYEWSSKRFLLSEFLSKPEKLTVSEVFHIIVDITEAVHYLVNVCSIELFKLSPNNFVIDLCHEIPRCKLLHFNVGKLKLDLGNLLLQILASRNNKEESNWFDQLHYLINTTLIQSKFSLTEFRRKLLVLDGFSNSRDTSKRTNLE
jgi:hypothetical protein